MKISVRIILSALILYLFSMVFFYFFQERFIFQNEKLPVNYSYSFSHNFEEIDLNTPDGNTLNALLFTSKNPKGVLLYFHGNKGNLARWGEICSYFTNFNYDVFVIDYRSYGKSTGNFNEEMMYQDADLAYAYLKQNYDENKISIYGRSLGCTFAIRTAQLNNPEQLILESPFYNLKDVASYHYPLLPFKFLLKYKFNSNEYIPEVKCNTTIFHGTTDKVVPLSSGKKLYDISDPAHTSFVPIKNGTHHNLADFKDYQDQIAILLGK